MRYWVVLICCICSSPSMAQVVESQTLRPTINIGTSITNYDNVFNAELNHDTDTSVGVNTTTSVDQRGNYYTLNLSYDTYRQTYLQDSYDDESGTVGEGNITLGSPNSPLKWNISNTEQQTRREVVSTDTPNNRNQRSIVSTGPQLHLRLGGLDTFIVSASYQSTSVENSNADTKSDNVNVSWNRQTSLLSSFGLRANYSDTAPKSDTTNNFIQVGHSANYSYNHKAGSLSIGLGQSTVDGFRGLDEIDSETYNVQFNRELGIAEFTMSFNQSLSNNGLGDSNIFEYVDIGASEELDIEKRRSIQVNYVYPSLLVNTSLALSASEVSSISQTRNADDRIRHGMVVLTRRLPRELRVSANYRYSENNATNDSIFSSQFLNRFILRVQKRIGERFNTSCQLQTTQSRGGIVYKANSIGCDLGYRLL